MLLAWETGDFGFIFTIIKIRKSKVVIYTVDIFKGPVSES